MTKFDEEDISYKISVVAGFYNVKGNQCPALKHSQLAELPVTIYGLLVGLLTVLGISRGVSILGHRLIE